MFFMSWFKNNGRKTIKTINKQIQTDKGVISFNGEVTEEEEDFILECGLIYVFQNDMLPFKQMDDAHTFIPQVDGDIQQWNI